MAPEVIPLTEDMYGHWDAFCLGSDDAWFWHTTSFLDYTLNYKPELGPSSKSFLLVEGSSILAICPLILETREYQGRQVREFSYSGVPGPTPSLANGLSREKRDDLSRTVFRHVDELARENGVVCCHMRFSPLAPIFLHSSFPPHNYLMQFGFIPVSLNTQILSLDCDLEYIWNDFRRLMRRSVKKGEGILQAFVYDKDNISLDVFEQYREMHRKAAGRVTRPMETFRMMYDWIKNGEAFLVGVKANDKFYSFEHYNLYKNTVYAGSACNDPDFQGPPLRHFLEWEAIKWMKARGIKYYEVGWQEYGPLPYDFPSEKDLSISHFKLGFGGYTVPLVMGEKYYSRDYYLRVNLERTNKYASMLENDVQIAQLPEAVIGG